MEQKCDDFQSLVDWLETFNLNYKVGQSDIVLTEINLTGNKAWKQSCQESLVTVFSSLLSVWVFRNVSQYNNIDEEILFALAGRYDMVGLVTIIPVDQLQKNLR